MRMKFGEKLRLKRTQAHLTQEELARRIGLSKRTVEGYESGCFYPRRREVYDRLAQEFNVEKNWFLTEDDSDAATMARTAAEELVSRARALYAGGEMSESDKDALAQALMDAYWIARQKRAEDENV